MIEKLQQVENRYELLQDRSQRPDFYQDPKQAAKVMKELDELQPIIAAFRRYKKTQQELEEECAKIRETGVAFDDQEYEEGLYCISVPILNKEGRLVACLGISGGYLRMVSKKAKIISLLKDAKREIEVYTECMDKFVL